ncbi:MAG TPA: ROK family protein [Spirochaetia bacterium]|nr:ROK family protein [Spirochaetia bacterium]
MQYAAGVDFGGSSAKIGLVARDGSILAKETVRVDSRASFEDVLGPVAARLSALVAARPKDDALIVAGIGMPGFIEKREGTVVGGAENILCLRGRSPQAFLEQALGVPAFSENDATSAAAGELVFGAGRKFSSFLLITLGTAIGGGLVLGGKVYRGFRGFAGEVGHMCLVPDGVVCNCGSRGCFEQYASGTAVVRTYRERLQKRGRDNSEATAKTVFDLARSGDVLARETIVEASRYVAQALGSILNLLDVEACLVGGGVSEAGELLLEPVRQRLPDYCWPEIAQGVKVIPAELGNDAGIQGAAAQALERLEGPEGRCRSQ